MDTNTLSSVSGSVSYLKSQQEMFADTDTDGDGVLSLEEFSVTALSDAPAGTLSASEMFSTLDTDGSGSLSEEEMEAGAQNRPPPPPPGGGLMSSDTLTSLLEVLDEEETEEGTYESLLASASDDSDDVDETADVEEKVLELIQEGINAHQNATEAYASAQTAAIMMPGMQSYTMS